MKAWKVALIVGGVALLAVGTGVAFAQSDDPPNGEREFPRKFWNSNDRSRDNSPRTQFEGMLDGPLGDGSPLEGENLELHDLMLTIVADELDLTLEELEARMEVEGGLMAVLLAQDFSFEDARELLVEVQTEAIQMGIEQGLIDVTQAEYMLMRLQQFSSRARGLRPQGFYPRRTSGEGSACQVDS